MTNAIDYAIERIHQSIPRELLDKAFLQNPYAGYYDSRSLSARIKDEVMGRRVLVDCNLIGGQQIFIDINNCQKEYFNGGVFITVPHTLTQGRDIMSVFSAENNIPQYSDAMNITPETRLQFGASGIVPTGITNIQVVAPNRILINTTGVLVKLVLRCVIANDENLGNITPRHYPAFGELSVLGAKAIIYTKLSIAIGEGLNNPAEVSSYLRSQLDEYQAANEEYYNMLHTKWRKCAAWNDPEHRRIVNKLSIR